MDTISRTSPAEIRQQQIPSLENGDRLSGAEFERRYRAMPNLKKAELIERVVHIPGPVRVEHAEAHAELVTWLGVYCSATKGVDIVDNATVRLDLDNIPQPDAALRILAECGGSARVGDDGYLTGPPELIVEVASSSASYDLYAKKNVYRRSGVAEYLVWRVLDGEADWFVLRDGEYMRQSPDDSGILRSHVFPGLWLDTRAFARGDLATTLATLQNGLASAEHADFVSKLCGAG